VPAEPPDDALLLAAAGGDRRAFGELVRRHRAAVWRLVRSVAPTEALAEEALQEAFVAAWKGAGSWDGRGSARSWLLTLARHAAYRHVRRRAGQPADFEPLDALGVAAGWGDEGALAAVAAKERAACLRRALRSLSEADREILVLRELEELSGEETAAVLGLSLAATKSRLHRARLKLAGALHREDCNA
jgi:RNA polymerase sigma-70 factor (ECF subfamily)